jgi:putative NADPH-quinone reductase/1,4-dihydroxy-2-naphthoate octaprenyltransferase
MPEQFTSSPPTIAKPGAGPIKVLVVLGHPRRDSLCAALADAYVTGAQEGGADVRRLSLTNFDFEQNVLVHSPRDQPLEPDIADAVNLIAWAEHLVFVFPTWWGTMPACLKGFLDRVLMPGFAFADRDDGEGWDKLLVGKSAHLLTTMDTPPWVYRWIYRAPGLNALKRATLGFCGIEPVRSTIFGPVKPASDQRRVEWIEAARREGLTLRDGALTAGQRRRRSLAAWLASFRLQFHPMAWAAYAIGAAGAWRATGHFSWLAFWLGLAAVFFLEIATAFTNDEFDFESDVRNRHHGPFTGGSRVLVDGRISIANLHIALLIALGAFAASGLALATVISPLPSLPILASLGVLALGYTVPPLKLCWRGLGEIDVGVTHSIGVILCGYAFQGGTWTSAWPWLVAIPLFFAILPAITLSGIPDYSADAAVGKGTIAVRLGPRVATRVAQAMTAAAAITAVVLLPRLVGMDALGAILLVIVPYAILQVVVLERYLKHRSEPRRIDGLMAMSLTYVLWFVAIPLWGLI